LFHQVPNGHEKKCGEQSPITCDPN